MTRDLDSAAAVPRSRHPSVAVTVPDRGQSPKLLTNIFLELGLSDSTCQDSQAAAADWCPESIIVMILLAQLIRQSW